ncbi:MAG: MFS transporter [Mycobacteriales bacterium]
MSFTSSPTVAPWWRNRDLILVAGGLGLSGLGNGIVATTLMLYMQAKGHSPWTVAGILAADAIPLVLLSPLAGMLVDRLDSRRLIVAASLWQAACCVALAGTREIGLVFPLVVLLGAGTALAGPTYSALLPRIVGEGRITRASSITGTAVGIATIGAPAAGGLLYAASGLSGPFLIDAATFLVLAASIMAVRTRRAAAAAGDTKARARDGVSFVFTHPVLRSVMVMALSFVVVGEAVNVADVYLVRDQLHRSATVYGLIGMLWAGSALVGSVLAGRFEGAHRSGRVIVISAFGLAGGLATVVLMPTLWFLVIAFAACGLCNGALNVCVSALLLAVTPDAWRGRVTATFLGLVRTAGLGALALGGVLAGTFAPATVFAICGVASLIALALTARPLLHVSDARSVRSQPDIDTVPGDDWGGSRTDPVDDPPQSSIGPAVATPDRGR